MEHPFTVAAVQATSVFLDLEASLQKACRLIDEAANGGATLVVFPEAFLPGYPVWVWHIPSGHSHPLRTLYAELLKNSVTVPGPVTDRLAKAARKAGITLAIGINERNAEGSGTSLYNTLLYIGADGSILGKHRKLVPTSGERLVWAQGDGSDLSVYELPFGRLAGLICWENYMPLARYALYAWGVQVYAAPTWDHGEPWHSTLRHIGKEGRCIVIGCCSPMRKEDIPDHWAFKNEYLAGAPEWLNTGESMIVSPDGEVLAGPATEGETILYAEITPEQILGPRWQLDTAGHYARPDVFELRVHRRNASFISVSQDDADGNGESIPKVIEFNKGEA